jgi:hypothetical protein
LRRAGVRPNSSATSIRVPSAQATSRGLERSAPSPSSSVPVGAPRTRVRIRTRPTAAMLGSASPRNPRLSTRARSPAEASLLVAWRRKARAASAGAMPTPSSVTEIHWAPPSEIATSTRVASASREFSTSSFTTEAGRSMTSPAAIWLTRSSGSTRIRGMALLGRLAARGRARVQPITREGRSERRTWPEAPSVGFSLTPRAPESCSACGRNL